MLCCDNTNPAVLDGLLGSTGRHGWVLHSAARTRPWCSLDAPVLCLDSATEASWHNTVFCGLNQVLVQNNQVYTISKPIPI